VENQVHVFADGYDVESGPPSEVFRNPKHATTKLFLSQTAKD